MPQGPLLQAISKKECCFMPTTINNTAVRFHLSLNVADLARSVAFYRLLFGKEPAKRRPDYAKFELDDPPLVLSLEPNRHAAGGALNHLGFRLVDAAALVEFQARLEASGIRTQREEGVECCYARQTKFWVTDPDRNLWEIYVLEEDIEHRGMGQSLEEMLPESSAEPVRWEHRLGEPVPGVIPLADGTADEAFLLGSFNARLPEADKLRLLREAYRVLRPGGQLTLHNLVADGPFPRGFRSLPGPAAAVQHVPLEREPLQAVTTAGFVSVTFAKFGDAACFQLDGVEMRELLLHAWKPDPQQDDGTCVVVYKGPHTQVTDEEGQVYHLGERVAISNHKAQRLRRGSTAAHFAFIAPAKGAGCLS
jgi:catechol 2,3-dioxygenase-like lactoylglutathione lyase family enzyme